MSTDPNDVNSMPMAPGGCLSLPLASETDSITIPAAIGVPSVKRAPHLRSQLDHGAKDLYALGRNDTYPVHLAGLLRLGRAGVGDLEHGRKRDCVGIESSKNEGMRVGAWLYQWNQLDAL